jgi:hypothetical protein
MWHGRQFSMPSAWFALDELDEKVERDAGSGYEADDISLVHAIKCYGGYTWKKSSLS